ncbi:MAG: OmpA family protein [Roseococcus sp.]|nr:OmpA family protein [Roseococcus sp.]
MSLKKALLAATVLSLPVAAQAQPVSGLYVGAGVGANYRENVTSDIPATLGADRVHTRWGWAAVASIGWGFGNGIRAELEGNYRNNSIDRMRLGAVSGNPAGGTVHQYGLMGNAFYDLALGDVLGLGVSVTPYVGAGIGYAWNDYRKVIGRTSPTNRVMIDGNDGRFAYQGIAGVAFGLGAMMPGLSLTTEYRFFGTLDPSISSGNINNAGQTVVGLGSPASYRPTNYNHSILVGLRYAFNTPTPAPAPAPAAAPAPARTFLVFFDWDRADLTDRARQIIAEAANNARTVGSTRIEVSGHADRTGSAAYNQRLSVRRAEAVAAELVRRGIARNQITIQGFGFDRPLVPTAMGVREPQNRRVEIVLR